MIFNVNLFYLFRNEAIVQSCANHMDEKAAEIVKTILLLSENKSNRLSPTTSAIAYYEIQQKIIQTTNIKTQVSLISFTDSILMFG